MSTLVGEQAEPSKPSSLEPGTKNGIDLGELVTSQPPVAEPDGMGNAQTTSRRELWAFYLYYVVRCLGSWSGVSLLADRL